MNESRFVWLASYPRSGNTWLRFLLGSLAGEGRTVDINSPSLLAPIGNRHEVDQLLGIDSSLLTQPEIEYAWPDVLRRIQQDAAGHLIFRKVHECWRRNGQGAHLFPPELSLGAVFIVRDPRDVAVSFAHFSGAPLAETIERMADPEAALSAKRNRYENQLPQPLKTWSGHAQSWLDGNPMPVLLVRYEDLLADTVGQLIRVAAFLGLPAEGAAEAVEAARFDALQEQENRHGFREKRNWNSPFFREGKSGQWRAVLTAEQRDQILRDHGEMMARFGYS